MPIRTGLRFVAVHFQSVFVALSCFSICAPFGSLAPQRSPFHPLWPAWTLFRFIEGPFQIFWIQKKIADTASSQNLCCTENCFQWLGILSKQHLQSRRYVLFSIDLWWIRVLLTNNTTHIPAQQRPSCRKWNYLFTVIVFVFNNTVILVC